MNLATLIGAYVLASLLTSAAVTPSPSTVPVLRAIPNGASATQLGASPPAGATSAQSGGPAFSMAPLQWSTSAGGNDHYYMMVQGYTSWTVARSAASSSTYLGMQGYLATITSEAENLFLADQFDLPGYPWTTSLWIGGSDAAIEGEWRWVTGPEAGTQFWQGGVAGNTTAPCNFAPWGGTEPNNYLGEHYCVWSRGKWNYETSLGDWGDANDAGMNAVIDGFIVEFGKLLVPSVNYCTAGSTTHGCTADLSSTGAPSISAGVGFTLIASGVEGQKAGLVFYGISGRNAASWAPGSTSFLCVKSPVQRSASQNSGGMNDSCTGALTFDWLAYMSTHPGALGQPIGAGQVVNSQAWFRDPAAPGTTNLSDALEFTTCP